MIRFVIADTFSWTRKTHGETLIKNSYIVDIFIADNSYNIYNFLAPREKFKLNLSLYSRHPILFVRK